MRKSQQVTDLYGGAKNEHQRAVLKQVAVWAGYYRSNVHRFVEDFLGIKLKLFQIFLLVLMDACSTFVFIACRGLGKSFLCAVFCCVKCILYPGTRICIASGTRSQSVNVLEKIMNEILPNSPGLRLEIDFSETNVNNTLAQIKFRNGSLIKVVTASDSSRGNRANIVIIDEFRMVKKDVIDTILKKFRMGGMRRPNYLNNPKYAHMTEPTETLYLSSAYFKDHWSYTRCKDACRLMLDDTKSAYICAFPYELAINEGLLSVDDVVDEMLESDFNEIKWSMEMEAMFWGDSEGSFFAYNSIAKNRKIIYPMLPAQKIPAFAGSSKLAIPTKQPGERRILSADIALMASGKNQNDASAIFINQLVPTKAGRYTNNIVYSENNEGLRTDDEALLIRKLFDEFDCDYMALDVRNVGLSIFDALARDLSDPETGEVYPALSCCNNTEIANRCVYPDAKKVIWAITGTSRFNSECAILLREAFRNGKIRLLATEYDGEAALADLKGYPNLSLSARSKLLATYTDTTLLIGELINLKHEESSGLVKIKEKASARKDRYSSLSYNFWVSTQIEKELRRDEARYTDSEGSAFIFRAPRRSRESL